MFSDVGHNTCAIDICTGPEHSPVGNRSGSFVDTAKMCNRTTKVSVVQDAGLQPDEAIGTIHIVRNMSVKRVRSRNVHESVGPLSRHPAVNVK
jgi:hypothetical protein